MPTTAQTRAMMENFLTISKLYCSALEKVVIAMTPPLS
jgi:hypothetical protein